MRYDVGRFRRPMRRSTEGQLASLVSLGDGSTLTLDFTTGQLDPRLTFTRTSNATFINSSGLVQYADHNLATNTVFANTGTDVPTSWTRPAGTGTSGSNGTFVDGNEEWTQTAALTERPYLSQNITISLGLTYTCSVYLASAPSGLEARNIIWPVITTGSTQYYQDGVAITSSTVITPGRISVVFTPTSGSTVSLRVGLGCTNGNTVGTVVFSRPMLVVGDAVSKPYLASNPGPYQAPRFDHDPTTLAPKGLLIEGQSVNIAANSNLQGGWLGGSNTTVTANTSDVLSPDGTNNAAKVALTSAGYCSRFEAISGLAASTTYTFSYWIRGTAGNQQRVYSVTAAADLVTQSTLTYTSTGWTRVQITFTTGASGPVTVYVYVASRPTGTASDVLYIYGAQVELGTGASSLIPTGASTATRALESCVMTGADFSSWFAGATEGVLYAEHERPRSESGSTIHDHASVGTRYTSGGLFSLYVTGIPQLYPTALLWPTGGAIFPGGFPSAIPANTKAAARWFDGNDATNFSNGVQGTTGNGSGTVTPTMLCIGAHSTDGVVASRDFLNACVRQVKFWPVALPNSQIIALTAP